MSEPTELTLEQIRLSLSDYQSELSAIDAETLKEKERILSAIKAEEAEIKSLLDRYRNIKRQKEVELVESSYKNLSNFKKNLLQKIESETAADNSNSSIAEIAEATLKPKNSPTPVVDGDEPKKIEEKPNNLQEKLIKKQPNNLQEKLIEKQPNNLQEKLIKKQPNNLQEKLIKKQPNNLQEKFWEANTAELIKFIEETPLSELVQLYPADVSMAVPSFNVNNTDVRNQLLEHYQKHNVDIYNYLLKLYQKPDLGQAVKMPNLEQLSLRDRQYHEFLKADYPNSLPFFWFLINREPDSIRYVVMEFAIDHIIHTNTLENDPRREELSMSLLELLEMNNKASLTDT